MCSNALFECTLSYNIDGSGTYDFEQDCMVDKPQWNFVLNENEEDDQILVPIHEGVHTVTTL